MPCFWFCNFTKDSVDELRKWREEWDLRILIPPIVIAHLYLHFFGPRRIKSTVPYFFADLLATTVLGKLSNIDVQYNNGYYTRRVMWAPLILFYLGGPDTITILHVEENESWMKHLIGLLVQGLTAAYALLVTWNPADLVLSLLALLVFIPGIIKYGERVWVLRSRSNVVHADFVCVQLHTIDKFAASLPIAEPVLLAYSWFRTLMPHIKRYEGDAREVRMLVTRFRQSVTTVSFDAFKLTEIELGLTYDILCSKVGTIFTLWGSLLRFLSFSLIASVLVIYTMCNKPCVHSEGDHIVTIILLVGAIFLEIAGIVAQLVSDWALVWACNNGTKWATLVLFLHGFLTSKSQKRSVVMWQFNLREFCENYKPTVCNRTWECLFGREKMLKRFSSQKSLDQHLKDLIIHHLREKLWEGAGRVVDVGTSQASTQIIEEHDNLQNSTRAVKRGEWTFVRYGINQQFMWCIDIEFGQSIVIWHIATEACYESDYPKIFGEEVRLKAVKILSDYMMYLLLVCPDIFPFCIKNVKLIQHYAEMKTVFQGVVENEGDTTNIPLVDRAKRLVQYMKGNPMRWDIMRSMWAEMLCYAATKCPVKNHIQELRHGGEFLTHVWLLLRHFGITKQLERSTSSLKDEYDSGVKAMGGSGGEIEGDQKDRLAEKLEENEAEIDLDTGLIQ